MTKAERAKKLPVLKRGCKGAAVTVLQEELNKCSLKSVPVDGSFGPLTEESVKGLQNFFHIAIDGSIGPITWGKLIDYKYFDVNRFDRFMK